MTGATGAAAGFGMTGATAAAASFGMTGATAAAFGIGMTGATGAAAAIGMMIVPDGPPPPGPTTDDGLIAGASDTSAASHIEMKESCSIGADPNCKAKARQGESSSLHMR